MEFRVLLHYNVYTYYACIVLEFNDCDSVPSVYKYACGAQVREEKKLHAHTHTEKDTIQRRFISYDCVQIRFGCLPGLSIRVVDF